MKRLTTLVTSGLIALAATLASGCATMSGASAPKVKMPKTVQDRAVKRWELLIAHHAEDAYDYLSPGYRAIKNRHDYAEEMNHRPVAWKEVHFMDQHCEEDTCTVRLEMEFVVPMRGAPKASGVNVVEEKWIRVSTDWFFLPDQMGASVTGKGLH